MSEKSPSSSKLNETTLTDVKQLGLWASIASLSYVFWIVGGMEMVERLAYYGVRAVATSPDGAHVYATGYTAASLAVFDRDETTGTLAFVEVHKNGVDGISSLAGAHGAAVSPDGANVYVASSLDNSLTVFSRDAVSGTLALLEIHTDGIGPITSLAEAETISISPDGSSVYVTAKGDDAVTLF